MEYGEIIEKASASKKSTPPDPLDLVEFEKEHNKQYLSERGMIKGADNRYANAFEWALGTNQVIDLGEKGIMIREKLIPAARRENVYKYLTGGVHGNATFPGKTELQDMMHRAYKKTRYPSHLPFRLTRQQRSSCFHIQKKHQFMINKWIDSLPDKEVFKIQDAFNMALKKNGLKD